MAQGRSFARSPRRRTHWTEIRSTAVTLTATGASLLTITPSGHEGETLIRTRGIVGLTLSAATAITDGFFGAFGMAVVSTASATAGVASIPTPLTEAGWDGWFVHRYFDVRASIDRQGPQSVNLQIDSKAMRKVNEDESIVMVVDLIETGSASLLLFAATRVLSMVG